MTQNALFNIGRYAMISRDPKLFQFWLRCCQEAQRMNSEATFKGFTSADWQFAVTNDFIDEMAEMIRYCGVELPLDDLIKQSGVTDDEKPKYYQGLSIGGKKMTNWAQAHGERAYRDGINEKSPPLLQAAHQGSLGAVEWFLSDTPFRLYREYGAKNSDDPQLKMLARAHGGFDLAVGTWLKQRSMPLLSFVHQQLLIGFQTT